MAGCSSGNLTPADFAQDLRQVVTASSAWTKDYKNRELLEKANKLTIDIRDKYRGSEVATKEFKPDFETLGLLSTSLMLAKSSPDPSQPPPSSSSSALELTHSSLALLKMSKLLGESPTPQGTP